MGKLDFEIPVEWLKRIGKMSEVEKYAPQMLDEAAPILMASLKRETAMHDKTGELSASLKFKKAKKNVKGIYYVNISPTGNAEYYIAADGSKKRRATPIRNAAKMVYLEYGTKNMSARPMIAPALKNVEQAVLDKMQSVFNREAAGE